MIKTNEIQDAALNIIHLVSTELGDKTTAGAAPFNTNATFNARLEHQMRVGKFVLDNATWDELVARAQVELDGDYSSERIAQGMFGNAVNYVLITLVFSYGIARAVKRLNRANRHLTLYSTPLDIATDIAFRLLEDRSVKSTGYETIQAQVIRKRLNAAQTKAHIDKMVQNGVSNYIKGLQVQGKFNPLLIEPLESEEVGEVAYEEPALSVEDQIQLEYLYDFMRNGYEDIIKIGGPAAVAMSAYCSDRGQDILEENNSNLISFYGQLLLLIPLTDLTEQETKQAHDQILEAYWQLTKCSYERQVQTRTHIDKRLKSAILKRNSSYQGRGQTHKAKVKNVIVHSHWIDNDDVDLMRRQSIDGFFSRMPNEFALN